MIPYLPGSGVSLELEFSQSPFTATGTRARIPAMMSRLMPLPIPNSSICSPTHIRKMVPAVMIDTETRPCQKSRYCGRTTFIWGLIIYWTQKALCTAHKTTVAYRVYSLIRFRPLSPSFIMASREGTTLPRSWKMIEAEI